MVEVGVVRWDEDGGEDVREDADADARRDVGWTLGMGMMRCWDEWMDYVEVRRKVVRMGWE